MSRDYISDYISVRSLFKELHQFHKLTDSDTKLPSFLQRIATLDFIRQLSFSSLPANITVSLGCVLNAEGVICY